MSKNNQTTLSEISKKTREENAKDGLSRSIVEPQTEAQKEVLKKTKERKEDCIRTEKPKLEKPKEPIQKRKPSPKARERTKMMVREQKGIEKEKKKKETTKKDGIARKTNVNEVKETRLVSLVVGGVEKQLPEDEYQKLTPFLESAEKKVYIWSDEQGMVKIRGSPSLFDALFSILRNEPKAMPIFDSDRIELLLEAEHYMLNEVVGKIKSEMKSRIAFLNKYKKHVRIKMKLDSQDFWVTKELLINSECVLTEVFFKEGLDEDGIIVYNPECFNNKVLIQYINGFGYNVPTDAQLIENTRADAKKLRIERLVDICDHELKELFQEKEASSSGSEA